MRLDKLRFVRKGSLYLPYSFNQGNNVLGHYRASSGLQTTTGTVGAGGIVFSGCYGGPNLAAVLGVYIDIEITHAVTTAINFDFNLFSFRGATGKAAGTSSVVATLSGQQMRSNMANPLWSTGTNGEMRSLGGSLTGLTAAGGKTNSGSPIGSVSFAAIANVDLTSTAVALVVGAMTAPAGLQPLYQLQPGISHPLTLGPNDGLEIQRITAAGGQDLSYLVVVEWAEILQL